ncbi:maleylacetoacetate isomerase [Sphingobium bisphenolivorans]|uniref:maleylacetoacetate isomerase n=1 Tax=Sphingobium bisphenolivorans TaxID=1335760 RepID=UPI0003A88853|nr:maleylacetoacetate isomerase [Sphingobium bisphenolivorans]
MSDILLHGYWRSSAAYRVRIALHLKGIEYRQVSHDLRAGEQQAAEYRAIAPHGLVPALQSGDAVLIESPAILEWMEERWPAPPLFPADPNDRALVRAMAAIIGCDVHPLNNLRVLNALRSDFAADKDQVKAWAQRWIAAGFTALEQMVERHGGRYAFGDEPGMADVYIVPQIYNARRFSADLTPFPHLVGAGDRAAHLPAFQAAHPDRQPDASH